MDRTAVFVDAGYLYATGSVLLTGEKLARNYITLDTEEVSCFFKEFAERETGLPLLRIYWYDGLLPGSTQQEELMNQPNVKVRLGRVKGGHQELVDNLILEDMAALALNKAMATAVLITGDGDLIGAVKIVQNLGVRVHVVGTYPHEDAQSRLLIQDADVTHELRKEDITRFMSIVNTAANNSNKIYDIVKDLVNKMGEEERLEIGRNSLDSSKVVPIPMTVDRELLTSVSSISNTRLSEEEKREIREMVRQLCIAEVQEQGHINNKESLLI